MLGCLYVPCPALGHQARPFGERTSTTHITHYKCTHYTHRVAMPRDEDHLCDPVHASLLRQAESLPPCLPGPILYIPRPLFVSSCTRHRDRPHAWLLRVHSSSSSSSMAFTSHASFACCCGQAHLPPAVLIFCKWAHRSWSPAPELLAACAADRLGSNIWCYPCFGHAVPLLLLGGHLASIAFVAVLALSVPLGRAMHARPTDTGASFANA